MKGLGAIVLGGLVLGATFALARSSTAAPDEDDELDVLDDPELIRSPGQPGLPHTAAGQYFDADDEDDLIGASVIPPAQLLAAYTAALFSTDAIEIRAVAEALYREGYRTHASVLFDMAEKLEDGLPALPAATPINPTPRGRPPDPYSALAHAIAPMSDDEAQETLKVYRGRSIHRLTDHAAQLRDQGYVAAALVLEGRADELRLEQPSQHVGATADYSHDCIPLPLATEDPADYLARVGSTY